MVNPQDLEKIDSMRKNLYSRKHPPEFKDERTPLGHEEYSVAEQWSHPESEVEPGQGGPGNGSFAPLLPQREPGSFFRKVLIISLLFFIVSSALALFVFFGGFNIISSNNVEIDVAAPVSVPGGAELPLEITVRNKNNSDLEYANLLIEYPAGTRSSSDINTELTRDRIELGTIGAGKNAKTIVKSVLFGEEHSTKDIKIVLEYKVKNSNGSFFKEKNYSLTLSASPVTLTVNTLKEVSAGQEFTTTVEVTSNSNTPLNGLLVYAEYPFGFDYLSSAPSATYDNSIWSIGSLAPGEKKTITLKGKIEGQDGEDRTVRFTVGTQNPDDEKLIKTPFVTNLQTIAIKKPFIGIELSFNREDAKDYVAEGHDRIGGVVRWTNNLPTQMIDGEIEVKITGIVLDRESVSPNSGFFRSVDNTIFWDKRSSDSLSILEPGESGEVSFGFAARSDVQTVRNPQLTFEVNVKAKRVSESKVPETMLASIVRKVKVATELGITSEALYSVGPFTNTGPLPPKADTPTTYTIHWKLSNTANNVSGGTVRTVLPQYVSWVGAATSSEKVFYNSERNEVIWQPGQVVAGTGITGASREAYFQIRLVPSVTQLHDVLDLIGGTEATAHDIFTNTDVEATVGPTNTTLINDPKYKDKSGQVGS